MPIDLTVPLDDDTATAVYAYVLTTPHGSCAGWTHDCRDPRIVCACGATIPMSGTLPVPGTLPFVIL